MDGTDGLGDYGGSDGFGGVGPGPDSATDSSSAGAINGMDSQSDAAAAASGLAGVLGMYGGMAPSAEANAMMGLPSFGTSEDGVVGPSFGFSDLGIMDAPDFSVDVSGVAPFGTVSMADETDAPFSALSLQGILNSLAQNKGTISLGLAALSMLNPALAPVALGLNTLNAINADTQSNSGKGTAGMIGSMVGSSLAGPLGGQVGSALGQGLAGMPGTPGGVSTSDGSGMNYGDLFGYGLGAYMSNRAAGDYGSQASNLASLYGQDSPYAQALRRQLAAKDAQRGRRSQYGAREVDLQARLADVNSRNAPVLAQLSGARMGSNMNTLANLYRLYNVANQGGAVNRTLMDLFNPATVKGYSGVEGDMNFMGPINYSAPAEVAPQQDFSYLFGPQ